MRLVKPFFRCSALAWRGVERLEEVAFALDDGDVSGPIAIKGGEGYARRWKSSSMPIRRSSAPSSRTTARTTRARCASRSGSGTCPSSTIRRGSRQMEKLRDALAAGQIDLAEAVERLGGGVRELGWRELDELAGETPPS